LKTYGLDANLIMDEIMDAGNRDLKIGAKIKEIENYISEGNIPIAKSLLEELEQKTNPTQSILVRLRAIINRIEIIGR
jgi:hypothetical protein